MSPEKIRLYEQCALSIVIILYILKPMISLGLKQIFKLATNTIHAVLFVWKCPGNGMYAARS